MREDDVLSTDPQAYCPLTMDEQSKKCRGCKVKLSVPEDSVKVETPFHEGFFRAVPHSPVPFVQEMLRLNGVKGYFPFFPMVRDWLKAKIHDAGLGKLEQIIFVPFVNLSGQLKFWPINLSRERIDEGTEEYKAETEIARLAETCWVAVELDDETGLTWGQVPGCCREIEWTTQEVNDAFIRADFNNYYINSADHPYILWALKNGQRENRLDATANRICGNAAKGVH